MNSKILFFLICFLPILGISQKEFAPIGAKWYYSFNDWKYHGYALFESYDTVQVNEMTCKRLSYTKYLTEEPDFLPDRIVCQDSFLIYEYKNDTLMQLYNFAANVGDTMSSITSFTPISGLNTPGNIFVNGISKVEIKGDSIKCFITGMDAISGLTFASTIGIIDGIGATGFLFPEYFTWLDLSAPMGLRCYEDPKLGTISFNESMTCDNITVNIKNKTNKEVMIFPSIVKDKLFIKSDEDIYNAYYSIIQSNGTLLKRGIIRSGAINTSELVTGIYLLQIELQNNIISYSFKFKKI